jgi:hypothetical protein
MGEESGSKGPRFKFNVLISNPNWMEGGSKPKGLYVMEVEIVQMVN